MQRAAFGRRSFSVVAAIGSKFKTDGNSLTSLLEGRVTEIPTKNLVNFQNGERWALMNIAKHSRAVGAGIASMEYKNDHTILVILPNNVDRTFLQLAASYAGCKVAVVEEYGDDIDVHACIKACQARAVFVSTALVPKVREAVPELILARTPNSDPRHFRGNMYDNVPISARDFPYLKQVFHTGTAKEPRFHLFQHLPLYFPVPNPLNEVKPMAEDAPFFSVLSMKGEVKKQLSRKDLFSQAESVKQQLKLQPDESVLLCTKGDPHSTMVGVLACMSSWAQLVVPNPKDASFEKFAELEKATSAIGDFNVPKTIGGRVAKLQ